MGSLVSSSDNYFEMNRKEPFEVTDENGYIFKDKYCIPEELLTIILSYVEAKDLVFNCRRVCKTWCNVIDYQVWRLKFQRNNYIVQKVNEFPWYACYWIFSKKNLWDRNLIKNGCGQEQLKHWVIRANGGDCWRVEKPPAGSEDFPDTIDDEVKKQNSCFATSYRECIKEQLVDLTAAGAPPALMDILQPNIVVSEWYSGRFDCLSTHTLEVGLCNEDKRLTYDNSNKPLSIVKPHQIGAADGWAWHKVTHVFKNYGPGIRYLYFRHGGKDRQFWAGHYGSKMTGASVTLQIPDSLIHSVTSEDLVDESASSSSHNVELNSPSRNRRKNRKTHRSKPGKK